MVNDGTQKVLIRSFEDLECHQAAREFRKRISHFCENLPKEEAYRLKDQIIRSTCSLTANLAEGYNNHQPGTNNHFFET
jgi:four helix bundle protein